MVVGRVAEPTQPKVGDDCPIVRVEQDVVRLKVAVHHAQLFYIRRKGFGVGVVEGQTVSAKFLRWYIG